MGNNIARRVCGGPGVSKMAGKAGSSGGSNRTMSPRGNTPGENLPKQRGLARQGWYLHRERKTREEIFDALATKLNDLGLTDQETDGPIVAFLAAQYEILQDATQIYDADGPCALIGRALASRVISESQKEIRSLLGEYYLTPSTRSQRPDAQGEPDSIMKLMEFSH